jgi:hypothetical protein
MNCNNLSRLRRGVVATSLRKSSRYRLRVRVLALGAVAALLAACGTSTGDGKQGGHGGADTGGADTGGAGAKGGGSSGGTAGSAGSSATAGATAAGAGGSSAGASGSNTGGDAGGALPCGAESCGAAQYCVFPCCGGAAPACMQLPEGTTCPAGFHSGCFGGQCSSPATCCQADPCTPPPPYCSDKLPIGCLLEGRSCRIACA